MSLVKPLGELERQKEALDQLHVEPVSSLKSCWQAWKIGRATQPEDSFIIALSYLAAQLYKYPFMKKMVRLVSAEARPMESIEYFIARDKDGKALGITG